MELIRCNECKGQVYDAALLCPYCGFGLPKNLENILLTQKTEPPHQGIYDESSVPLTQDEKRACKRINIRMMAKINKETVRICNISKGGMKLVTAFPHHDPNLDITLDNGEKVFNIKGIIRWVSSKNSFSNLIDMGVKIAHVQIKNKWAVEQEHLPIGFME
jgi:hypothetical protein